jgi:hypothetical protein
LNFLVFAIQTCSPPTQSWPGVTGVKLDSPQSGELGKQGYPLLKPGQSIQVPMRCANPVPIAGYPVTSTVWHTAFSPLLKAFAVLLNQKKRLTVLPVNPY